MKQIKLIIAAFALLFIGSLSANAQKIGYVDGEALVSLLPEIKGVQEKIQKYQIDTIDKEGSKLLRDYQEKDSVLKKTTVASVKEVLQKDLAELANTLNNWQSIANQAIQGKQAQLLAPLYEKVRKAIQDVAKEKGYTYVLSPDVMIVSPPSDDLTPAVAAKLGVKLPAPGATPAAARN